MKTGDTSLPRHARRHRKAVFTVVAAALFMAVIGGWRIVAGSPTGRHVIVISVDGMGSGYYMSPPPGLHIPNLRRLMKEGSYAEAVEGIYPTVTYPSHTTLVTGRLPAEHGIYTNLSSRVAGKHPRDWFWFAKAIKVPTLWDEAHRAHLTSASVAWPVSVGADVDWDVPEIWNPDKPATADPLYVAQYISPLLSVELLAGLGRPKGGADSDSERTRLGVYLLEKHKPNLLLVHLDSLDDAEHGHGPGSPEADAALERTDAHVGEFIDAVRRAGLEPTTDLFVISDHGFMRVHRQVAPNLPLIQAGLFTTKWGGITGGKIVTVANGGSFFIYWPKSEDLWSTVDAALKPLRDQGLVWSVFDREALKDMGADPDAQMALEAPDGTEYNANSNGALIEEEKPAGTHGFLPYRKGLEASFIAWGPGIRPGVDLHRIPMTAVAPTILKALGVNDPKFGDSPPLADALR